MANDPGYQILSAIPDTTDKTAEEKLADIMPQLIPGALEKYLGGHSILGHENLGWGVKCSELFHNGLDVSSQSSTLK
jgi:hypothetical protein